MSGVSEISKREYETLAEYRYALRLFLRFSETAAKHVGLTTQQHQSLLAIMGYPGRDKITIGELADRLQIRHHSAVGLVNRLEAEDLIDRSSDPDDRRKVFITLTERGLYLLERLSRIHREELRQISPQLHRLLEQIDSTIAAERQH